MNLEEYYNYLIDTIGVSEELVNCVTDLMGYNEEILDDILYWKTSYRNIKQYLESEDYQTYLEYYNEDED